jgi:hypothetical protein
MTIASTSLLIAGAASVQAQDAMAQPSIRELPGIAAPTSQPPARLIVDDPLPDALAAGRAVIQFRTENLRIVPVFGPGALTVIPRVGHVHVTVDDAQWHWAYASPEPLIINGLSRGSHRVLVELADPTHKVIGSATVRFEIPAHVSAHPADASAVGSVASSVSVVADSKTSVTQAGRELPGIASPATQPPARLTVDAPLPEQLARGLAVIQYRAENLRIEPVYGKAALAVTPRIGHVHVTVDNGPWRWLDASGEPLIIQGLAPGAHRVLVQLVDPTHRTLAAETVSFQIPPRHPPES